MQLNLLFAQVLGTQYYDTGWVMILFVLIIVSFVLFNIARAQSAKKELFIRRIAGLNAIDEAIGRSTEMGKPVLMVPGLGGLNAISVQALNIFAHVTRTAARFANPIRLCCGDPAVYAVAQEVIRDVYQNEGIIERYDQDSVRFLSDRQFAFAAAVSGTILREQTSACFFMGEFFAESLIFAETANSIGAIQVASSTEITQTPFFIAACDYVLIGEEFYAASAYLTREPVLVGSLVGQDWAKLAVIAFVLAAVGTNSIQRSANTSYMRNGFGEWVKMDPNQADSVKINDTWYNVRAAYADVKDVSTEGQTPNEDGSITITFPGGRTFQSNIGEVTVDSITIPAHANRVALGKFIQREKGWEPFVVKVEEVANPDTARMEPEYFLVQGEQTIPIEEAVRKHKRNETLFGSFAAPGEPRPMETPRPQKEDENKPAEAPAEGEGE